MFVEDANEHYRILPHIQPVGASFFVTFRLYDSLPSDVFTKLQDERDLKIQNAKMNLDAIDGIKKEFYFKFNEELDFTEFGEHYLKIPEVADVVVEKLKEYDGVYYYLDAFCIMSNHVHVLFDFSIQIEKFGLVDYVQLSKVMQLIKGGSSFKINRMLNLSGKFWQSESYDTFIRDDKHRKNVLKYILNNPVKVGLCEEWYLFPYCYLSDRMRDFL